MEGLTPEQKTLLSLLGNSLFAQPLALSPNVDWEAVMQEAQAQAVFAVAFRNCAQLPLDDALRTKIKAALMKHALVGAACFQNHTYVHRLMQANDISYCAVKGAASAAYYPDPLLRSMGDVDFYVRPDDLDRTLAVLRENGFTSDSVNHPTHIGLIKEKKHFELHFKPVSFCEGRVGEIFDEYWSDIRECAVLHQSDLAEFYGPSAFHHGFILLTHLQHHLLREGVGLRHFLDWILFANSFSDAEFCDLFAARLKRIGLYRLAQLLSLGAVKHLGMAYRPWMGDDYETADMLLADIIYGGNFGRKDWQRVYEGLFITGRDSEGYRKKRFVRIFSSINQIVDYNWKSAKKCPLLYPVGWVYFTTRYLIRVLLGKRKMNLRDTYRKSGQRKQNYSRLRVFEPEE